MENGSQLGQGYEEGEDGLAGEDDELEREEWRVGRKVCKEGVDEGKDWGSRPRQSMCFE